MHNPDLFYQNENVDIDVVIHKIALNKKIHGMCT